MPRNPILSNVQIPCFIQFNELVLLSTVYIEEGEIEGALCCNLFKVIPVEVEWATHQTQAMHFVHLVSFGRAKGSWIIPGSP